MDDPVQWPNADITYEPDSGYKLRLPLWADARALSLRKDRLTRAINTAMPGRSQIISTYFPMEVDRDARGTSAEPGEIVIGTETMITPAEAGELRTGIAEALQGATDESEKAQADDQAAAEAVLAIIRQPSE